jgi:hypothetical protein
MISKSHRPVRIVKAEVDWNRVVHNGVVVAELQAATSWFRAVCRKVLWCQKDDVDMGALFCVTFGASTPWASYLLNRKSCQAVVGTGFLLEVPREPHSGIRQVEVRKVTATLSAVRGE